MIILPRVLIVHFKSNISFIKKFYFMKKLIMVLGLFIFLSQAEAGPDEKLLSLFSKTFPLAENVKWSEDEQGYFVNFTQVGILSRISYDREGNFVSGLRYYHEENLPPSILYVIRKKFGNKQVFSITELSTQERLVYYLKLEDEKSWYDVKVTTSGDINVEDHFLKK